LVVERLIESGNEGNIEEVDLMTRSIYDITQQIPLFATEFSKNLVSQMRQKFQASLSEKGLLFDCVCLCI
jgi:hypothetical protein